jgi:hypothetical protein
VTSTLNELTKSQADGNGWWGIRERPWEGSKAQRFCLMLMDGEIGVWKRFGLNWWGIGRGRAIERCDGGGHHGFHKFCEMAFLTISKATALRKDLAIQGTSSCVSGVP